MTGDINQRGMSPARLTEFNLTLRKYKAGKKSIEDRARSAEEWWKLHNSNEARKDTKGFGGFEAKSGWLHNVIVNKHADAMAAYPEPMLLPREPGDQNEARMLSKIIPVVLEQNDFEEVYSEAMWQKCKTGTGIYMITWDSEKLNGLGDISIKNVDILSVFWEPGVKDIQDSKYFFHVQWMDNEELEAMYPALKDKLKSNSFTPTEYLMEDKIDYSGKSVVVDVYYKRWEYGRKVLHYCKYVGEHVLYTTEEGQPEEERHIEGFSAPAVKPARKKDRISGLRSEEERANQEAIGRQLGEQIRARNASLGMIEDDMGLPGVGEGAEQKPQHYGLYDHGLYPFVFDPMFPVEKSPCGHGYIDLAANNQEQADLMQTAFIHNVMAGARPRYFVRNDGSVNEKEFSDLSRQFIHVDGNLGDDSIKPVGYIALPGNYVSVRNNTIQELRETTGNTETAAGSTNRGVTSASGIAALQEASGKGSKDSTRGSYRAYKRMTHMVQENIRQFYDMPRRFRITGEQGQPEFVMYSNANLQSRPVAQAGGVVYSNPVFDIKVVPQKRREIDILSQNELALEFYSRGFFDPMQTDKVLMCLDMMEFEGKETLVQKIRQNGTLYQQMSWWQELAISLAMKSGDRALAAGLMQHITGEQAVLGQIQDGEIDLNKHEPGESGVTAKARDRAQQAAVPN